jgi:DNA-directed RNA polymerase subunit RPC12/RpoP
VIKFRCPVCGQKIAVDNSGAEAVIHCPTCAEPIVVPPRSTPEFRGQTLAGIAAPVSPRSLPATSESAAPGELEVWRDRAMQAEQRLLETTGAVRSGLFAELARALADRLFRTVLFQRRHLLDTQQAAAERARELETRLARIQLQLQQRLCAYEQRIAELERQLAAREQENRELITQRLRKAQAAMDHDARPSGEPSGNADLLLRV